MSIDDQIVAEQAKARARRATDLAVFLWSTGLIITFVVPWCIGGIIRNSSEWVPLRCWAAGSAAILIFMAAFLILRPWSARIAWVVVGFIALALAVAVFVPVAANN